jgi:2-haloacid dehalogenase
MAAQPPSAPKALLFDVFGTVVNWRGGLIAQLEAFGRERGIAADWPALADAWRGAYLPSMNGVRSGERPWTDLETLQRESLERLVADRAIAGLAPADLDRINLFWRALPPWPDSPAGLARLKARFTICTLSNGDVALLSAMAKAGGLAWDLVFAAETFRHYKPDPETYLGACALLKLDPGEAMMVAAHEFDLTAARALGLQTAYIDRPQEFGPGRPKPGPSEAWDIACAGIDELADRLGA